MFNLYRIAVPRKVAKAIHPVNLPSVRSLATPNMPEVRKARTRHAARKPSQVRTVRDAIR